MWVTLGDVTTRGQLHAMPTGGAYRRCHMLLVMFHDRITIEICLQINWKCHDNTHSKFGPLGWIVVLTFQML